MLLVWYPKCSTCQKARQFLDSRGIAYDLRDIKTDNPKVEELAGWHRRSGLPLKRFFNTSGLRYKSMELKDKLPGMTETQQLELLSGDGMLVRRPLLIGDDFVLVGFREQVWTQRLGESLPLDAKG